MDASATGRAVLTWDDRTVPPRAREKEGRSGSPERPNLARRPRGAAMMAGGTG
jgi:hypothetical protein